MTDNNYNYIKSDIDETIINSPIKNILTQMSNYISVLLHNIPYMNPNYITTFGIILNAFGLLNLINNEFLIFIFLFFFGYLCDIIDGNYAKKYNMESKIGKFYDKLADWIKLLTTYIFFSTLYKEKINNTIVIIVFIILICCNIHFIIKNNIKKYYYESKINTENYIDKNNNSNIIQKIIENNKFENLENICIDFWIKCFKNIKIKYLKKYVSFSKFFDETMVIIYLIIIMVYIHYK